MANVKKDFIVTSQVKNIIYFDAINNQFKVGKYQFKRVFEKPKVHSFNEITKVKWLEMENEEYCGELEILIKLEDDTKYYISLIEKPTRKRSFKYRKACKLAEEIVGYLEFIEQAKNMTNGFTSKPYATNN